jgi:hypothetical protein
MFTEREQDAHRSEEQARAQVAAIVEMVAALECDYERLADLKNEREELVEELKEAENAEADEDTTDAECDELESAVACARRALEEWDADYRTELDDLSEAAGECESEEQAREVIQQDPLSVEVRSGWYTPGADDEARKPEQYTILLCTGGPACRLIGELDGHGQPETVRVEHQDWFTPWTEYRPEPDEVDALLTYARCFYFGE